MQKEITVKLTHAQAEIIAETLKFHVNDIKRYESLKAEAQLLEGAYIRFQDAIKRS